MSLTAAGEFAYTLGVGAITLGYQAYEWCAGVASNARACKAGLLASVLRVNAGADGGDNFGLSALYPVHLSGAQVGDGGLVQNQTFVNLFSFHFRYSSFYLNNF